MAGFEVSTEAEERVGVREPELLKLEHRTGARGLGVSRAVCDDQHILRGVFRPRLDPLVRHVDGASYDHVTDAGACIKNDRSLARVSTLLHLLGRYPADDSGKLTEPPGLGCDRENARSAVPNFRRARLSSGTSPVVSPRATSALYHGAGAIRNGDIELLARAHERRRRYRKKSHGSDVPESSGSGACGRSVSPV